LTRTDNGEKNLVLILLLPGLKKERERANIREEMLSIRGTKSQDSGRW
jgi:HSP20 family molecular chaperone IbpA